MGTVVGPPKRVSAADRDDDKRHRSGGGDCADMLKRTASRLVWTLYHLYHIVSYIIYVSSGKISMMIR